MRSSEAIQVSEDLIMAISEDQHEIFRGHNVIKRISNLEMQRLLLELLILVFLTTQQEQTWWKYNYLITKIYISANVGSHRVATRITRY